jgi:hypothetical protein
VSAAEKAESGPQPGQYLLLRRPSTFHAMLQAASIQAEDPYRSRGRAGATAARNPTAAVEVVASKPTLCPRANELEAASKDSSGKRSPPCSSPQSGETRDECGARGESWGVRREPITGRQRPRIYI